MSRCSTACIVCICKVCNAGPNFCTICYRILCSNTQGFCIMWVNSFMGQAILKPVPTLFPLLLWYNTQPIDIISRYRIQYHNYMTLFFSYSLYFLYIYFCAHYCNCFFVFMNTASTSIARIILFIKVSMPLNCFSILSIHPCVISRSKESQDHAIATGL
jgi:hypothetical protein